MAELKTKKNEASVDKFIAGVADKARRDGALELLAFLKKTTKLEPKMWGPSIIGFGECHLVYDSGRELDWFPVGFSPRKANLAMYFTKKYETFDDDLKKLGKLKMGTGCVYITKLEDIDLKVLKTMVDRCMKMK